MEKKNKMNTDKILENKINIILNKLRVRKFDEVISEIKTLMKKYKDQQILYNILSLAYQEKGEFKKSIDLLSRALKSQPKNIFFLNNLGLSYYKSKEFEKAQSLNRVIFKEIGNDIVSSYKRAFNILSSEITNIDYVLSNTTNPGIFKTDYEKNLYKKVNELKKYFSGIDKDENFDETLMILSSTKKEIFDFFDNVKVNDESDFVKKNRLELINILCKTFENYIDFHLIEDINE